MQRWSVWPEWPPSFLSSFFLAASETHQEFSIGCVRAYCTYESNRGKSMGGCLVVLWPLGSRKKKKKDASLFHSLSSSSHRSRKREREIGSERRGGRAQLTDLDRRTSERTKTNNQYCMHRRGEEKEKGKGLPPPPSLPPPPLHPSLVARKRFTDRQPASFSSLGLLVRVCAHLALAHSLYFPSTSRVSGQGINSP